MAQLSFLGKRIVVGVMGLVVLAAIANYLLKWHFFGALDKQIMVACFFALAIAMLRWLPTREEWDKYRKQKGG